MAGALRKTMVYLGLSEEDQRHDRERYDDYESYDDSDRYDDESDRPTTRYPTCTPLP